MIDQSIFVDFGSAVPGDSYEHPLVAACCGEYDFDQLASSQPAYWNNCIYDAIQQTCASLPYYVWDMAATAKAAKKLVLADQLTKLGNDLGTGDGQSECIDTLYDGGPVEFFNFITDRHWNPAYNVWFNIESLEILEVGLPEDPADWLTCKSIYENDDTVVPDVSPGPVWHTLGFDSGSFAWVGADLAVQLVPDGTSELVIGSEPSGVLTLGILQLNGGPMRVDGVEIDRWRLSTLRAQPARMLGGGSFSIAAGALTFAAAVVVDADTLNLHATNATDLVLHEGREGWTIEPFSLVYTQDDGDAWTLDSSTLDFRVR